MGAKKKKISEFSIFGASIRRNNICLEESQEGWLIQVVVIQIK